LLPCTCVLQPKLVHIYQTSSILLSHLPIVASVSLRWLYSLLYSRHIKHFQVFGFLPYSSCIRSSLSVWPMSNNLAAIGSTQPPPNKTKSRKQRLESHSPSKHCWFPLSTLKFHKKTYPCYKVSM
jgi:hypothetical protein